MTAPGPAHDPLPDALRDDPIERALRGPSDPEPIVLRIRKWTSPWLSAVTLSPTSLAWTDAGTLPDGALAWAEVGGISLIDTGKGIWAQIRAIDGSLLGTIIGVFERGGPAAMLPHIVALYRADLFTEVGPTWRDRGGCIRREVVAAEEEGATGE